MVPSTIIPSGRVASERTRRSAAYAWPRSNVRVPTCWAMSGSVTSATHVARPTLHATRALYVRLLTPPGVVHRLGQDGRMSSTPDARELTLADFPVHRQVTTRWSDNDMYGHLNNAVYYELFDSAINGWQAEHVTIDPMTDATQGVVAESSCVFYAEVAFPAPLVVGVRVVRLGRSSVTYQLGLFTDPQRSATPDAAIKALGHWVHVEIDARTRRPTPIPQHLRALMEAAVVETPA